MKAEILSGELQFRVTGPDEVEILSDMWVRTVNRDWHICKGDRGDLSSYPWIGVPLYSPFEGALAGVWHDKRYQTGDCTRLEADRGWYELAVAGQDENTRMPKWKARLGYLGLRAGGWVPWNRYRKAYITNSEH